MLWILWWWCQLCCWCVISRSSPAPGKWCHALLPSENADVLLPLQELLFAAQALPLYPELALLHSRAANHTAALLLLALLPPRLVEGAIAYCRCG